jgi:cardiolipin synthase
MEPTAGEASPVSTRVLTLPNVISFARIVSIPFFCVLIADPDSTALGIVVFSIVVATDWIDGFIARRTGQVSELGKVLDPVADRLVVIAGVIALVARDAFPMWAAVAIVARDVAVLVAGAVLMAGRKIRIDVRWIGKLATFSLMCSIAWISWGALGYPLAEAATVAGWAAFGVGIIESYLAAAIYVRDIRVSLAA